VPHPHAQEHHRPDQLEIGDLPSQVAENADGGDFTRDPLTHPVRTTDDRGTAVQCEGSGTENVFGGGLERDEDPELPYERPAGPQRAREPQLQQSRVAVQHSEDACRHYRSDEV